MFHALFFGRHLEAWREKMDPTVVELVDEGRRISAVEYKSFEIVRTEQWEKLAPILSRYDALLCPTLRITAPPTGMTEFDFVADDASI